jgi:hypothetical protein
MEHPPAFQERVQERIGQLPHQRAFPVVAPAGPGRLAGGRLEFRIAQHLGLLRDRPGGAADGVSQPLPLLQVRTDVRVPDVQVVIAGFVAQPASSSARRHPDKAAELGRSRRHDVSKDAQHVRSVPRFVPKLDREHRCDAMQAELEFGHDPEVAAAAPDPPEQLGVLVIARPHDVPRRRHDLRRDDVVAREAVLPREPTVASAQGEPPDAGVMHHAARRCEAEGVRDAVQFAEQRSALDAGTSRLRIDEDPMHRPEVDHEPTFRR